MATKRKQIGFYADEDVSRFLDKLESGVKTKTINDAVRAWCQNPLTGEALEKLQSKLIELENNHIKIGTIVWKYIKERMTGGSPDETETFKELIDCLGYEKTGLILDPDDYEQYQFFDALEMLLIENALDEAVRQCRTLAERYSVFDHQEYAKHHRSLAVDLDNLKTRLKVSRRLKRLSFEAGLLSEALMALFYACQSDETKRTSPNCETSCLTER